MRRRSWPSDLLILACVATLPGCPDRPAPADAGAAPAPAAILPDGSTSAAPAPAVAPADGGRAADAGPAFAAGVCPSFDPDRWTPFTPFPEWACALATPSSKDKLPSITWEPCGREGFGPRCRRIKTAPGESLAFDGGDPRQVDVRGAGPGRLQIVLGCQGLDMRAYVVGDLDGPVTGALSFLAGGGCRIVPELRASGWGADIGLFTTGEDQGVAASLTAVRGQWVPTKGDGALPSEPGKVPRALGEWRHLPKTEAVAAVMGIPAVKAPRLWVDTDGTDVVWVVSAGAPVEGTTCSVFTGRWVDRPQDVVATHVVDLPCMEVTRPWRMRCGFAATQTGEGQALLLRLADGVAYRFPKLGAALDSDWTARTAPLDLACKEVFLAVGGASPNVFRVPFDALPAGTPPPEPPKLLGAALDAGAGDAGHPPAR